MKKAIIIFALICFASIAFSNKLMDSIRISNLQKEDSNDDKKPFTVTDLHQLRKIGEVLMSPDRKYLVFQQTQWSFETKKSELVINWANILPPTR